MRSSTGSMSQARNAVLAAAMPMQTKANAIQLAYRQMKSRTSRRTRASELNACAEIPDLSCMGPAASVRGGRRDWQGRRSVTGSGEKDSIRAGAFGHSGGKGRKSYGG